MPSFPLPSWGNYPIAPEQCLKELHWRTDELPRKKKMLPRGLGRSYGDSCLNEHGILLSTTHLTHILSFDEEHGRLRAEAGISYADILSFVVPKGWFVPVTPGTKYVTLGGAIANDIHGKNHHLAGTIGCHIACFELLRSDGTRLLCSPTTNTDLFRATIGGLGLTGLITWAEIQLIPIKSTFITQETLPFSSLQEFFAINDASDKTYTYTVAWINTTTRSQEVHGIFFRGNHSEDSCDLTKERTRSSILRIPCFAPSWLLNPLSMHAFNIAYGSVQHLKQGRSNVHYDPFFYPLDAVQDWNKLYGRPGFLQYQFVVPREAAPTVVPTILEEAKRTGTVAFLSVLKTFGTKTSPGILSFPRPGITLAMDVRFRGKQTLDALDRFDQVVLAHQGRIYPAKDAHMSPAAFQACYPELHEFIPYVDPAFSSQFWRRVMPDPSLSDSIPLRHPRKSGDPGQNK